MEQPIERLQRILNENNLTAVLIRPEIRYMDDGALLIEQPKLQVTFTKEEKDLKDEPANKKVDK